MTIGKTGVKIVDDIARSKAKAQAEERRAKSAAQKSARAGKAKAGRSAIRSNRGRGVAAKNQKSGAGARGLVGYAMDKKDAMLLSSNAGTTKAEIIRDLRAASHMRPNIKSPFGHVSFSLPPTTGKIDEKRWIEIADFARAELELDDSFPFAVVRHNDTEHDHIHLIFSRVSFDGRVNSDSMIGLRLAALEDQLEDRFGLPLTPKPSDPTPSFKKGEIEKAIRTGFTPERQQLFQIVHAAAKGSPTAVDFVKKCAAAGAVVRPNLASTGRLNGFSFSLRGSDIEFKGSQLRASWGDLQKMGVTYVEIRDVERLAALSSAVASGQRSVTADDRKMESTQCETVRPNQTAERDDHARTHNREQQKQADRSIVERTAQDKEPGEIGPAMQRYLAARAADDERRALLSDIKARLAADPRPAAQRLAELISAEKTDRQIAAEFIATERCSAESRTALKMLNLTHEDEAEVLAPYRQQIEQEKYHAQRMHDAEKNAPTPDNNPSDLPTF